MPFTERIKYHGRRISNAVLRPRNPDPNSLNLDNLIFKPNINLPTPDSSACNSPTSNSRESTLGQSGVVHTTRPRHQVDENRQSGIVPPIPPRNPERLRRRRRDTSPGHPSPEALGLFLARSTTDPNSFELEQSLEEPISEVNSSHWQLQGNGLVTPSSDTGSGQNPQHPVRGRSYQRHRRPGTSPARTTESLFQGIAEVVQRSASVPHNFLPDQASESPDGDSARVLRHRISPNNTFQDSSQGYQRLLASSVFDISAESSPSSLEPEDPIEATFGQSSESVKMSNMAAIRASTFLDPTSARLSRLPESQRFTRIEAKHQEAVIHAKLKSAGEPIPPYEFQNFIGKGSYGRVYLARDTRNDRRAALKIIDVDMADYKADPSLRNANLETFMHEYTVLKQLEGAENVNQIYEILDVHSQVWIVSEYCPGGSVHTLMQAMDNKIEEKYIRAIARELAKGLKAVHDADVIHRDIKAANVMIHENGSLQIIDFGVSGMLETKADKRTTIIGTPHWMGPELLKGTSQADGKKLHGKEIDTWSYGCTLFEMATGQPPNSRIPQARLDRHLHIRGPPRLKVDDDYSQELSDFIAFTLQLEPEKRPTMSAILEHPYIRDTEEVYPTSSLADLVKKFERWAYAGGQRTSIISPYGAEAADFTEEAATKTEWRFSTLESTEILEQLSSDLSFDVSDPSDNNAIPSSHLPTLHIDPIADISSAQAQEDSLNAYFEGEPADEYLDEELADEIYKPNSLPQSSVIPNFEPDEASVRRGANHLGSLFDQASDLPLRGQTAGAARHDADGSTSGSLKSGKNLANIDTLRANSYNARPPTMNLGWDFPGKAHNGAGTHDGGHPNLKSWAPDAELDYGSPSDEIESSYDEEPYMPPTRPALRHAATEPIHMNDISNDLNPVDSTRGSRLDMDALMGTLSVSSSLYATPAPNHYDQNLQAGSAENLDLDAMTSDGDVDSLNDRYANSGDTPRDHYAGPMPSEQYDSSEGHLGAVPTPQPPSAEAMATGAPQIVLEMEIGRLAEAFRSGLGILSQQFGSLLEEDSETLPMNGEEKPAPGVEGE